jgi:hypothetical protein
MNTLKLFFSALYKFVKKFWRIIQKVGKKNRKLFEIFQLSLIYFLATVTLLALVVNTTGDIPKWFPFNPNFFRTPLFFVIATPEKTFIIYLLINELVLIRDWFGFSTCVRYNILYLILWEMIESTVIAWWDILFNIDTDLFAVRYVDEVFARSFFLVFFVLFFTIYCYSYICALRGKLPRFPNSILQKIPDSVAFWLRLRKY